jgi:predicted nucleic acid-binding protein
MERLAYILDTNAVSDYINQIELTTEHTKQALRDGHILYLCQPVVYEVLRGLIKARAERKRRIFEEQFAPQLTYLTLTDADWLQAAEFWATTSGTGKQLVDADLLIAALTKRVGGVLVTADEDFNVLPIKRENWRKI